jgi:hypothetical protein
MPILVVPMDPAFLPEAGLIIAGAFTGVAAVSFLFTHRHTQAARLAAASVACFALVFVMAMTLHNPPKPARPYGPRVKPEAAPDSTASDRR